MGELAPFQHPAQLANAVTGFATCMAGIMPMLYCWLVRPHPRRWHFAYFCILLTGIPTVWLHAYEGNRIASATDTGSNIFLTWAIHVAIAGDFFRGRTLRAFLTATTAAMILAIGFLYYEALYLPVKIKLIDLGAYGYFHIGQTMLIVNGWVATGLFFAHLRRIPARAGPLLLLVFVMFFTGMVLASAGNARITWRIFAWHSVWHLLGAFALITLWLFNDVRFYEPGRRREEI